MMGVLRSVGFYLGSLYDQAGSSSSPRFFYQADVLGAVPPLSHGSSPSMRLFVLAGVSLSQASDAPAPLAAEPQMRPCCVRPWQAS